MAGINVSKDLGYLKLSAQGHSGRPKRSKVDINGRFWGIMYQGGLAGHLKPM